MDNESREYHFAITFRCTPSEAQRLKGEFKKACDAQGYEASVTCSEVERFSFPNVDVELNEHPIQLSYDEHFEPRPEAR